LHVDYQLDLPPALKVHDVFHVDRLSAYRGNEVNRLMPPPPEPVTVEGEDTWEPSSHLQHAPEKVNAFYMQNPGAPRKVTAVIHASLPWQFHTDLTEINADVDPLGGG